MPEGDTILRTARTLERALGGAELLAVRSSRASEAATALAGRRVARVEARGKNLLIWLDDGTALYTHLRMRGSWHLYRRGERIERRSQGLVGRTTYWCPSCQRRRESTPSS